MTDAAEQFDSKGLGRLRRVANPRDVWTSESGDFTPWLAANIDVLGDALGTVLSVTGTEVSVGEFRLDICAEDTDGRVVVIENQLERSDHSHLGQCLVYASGLDASTVVWIAPLIRDDFRRALDWLNERTDVGIRFFGVELSVVQIGEGGPRAPVFDVVARPNDWQKINKSAAGTATSTGATTVSPLNARRQEFFLEVLQDVVRTEPSIRIPATGRLNWLSFAAGPFGYWALSVAGDGQLRIECYLDTGTKDVNKALFDELARDRSGWERRTGIPLSWERLDTKRASRVAAYHAFSLDDEVMRAEAHSWASTTLRSMYAAMNTHLRGRAAQLRAEIGTGASSAAPAEERDPG